MKSAVRTIALVAMAAVAAFASAGAAGAAPFLRQGGPSTLILVFADVSKSTMRARPQYVKFFSQVLDVAAASHATVIADQIDGDPLSTSSLPLRGDFWESSLLGKNPLQVKQHNDALHASLLRGFKKLLTRDPKGDSILDSLLIAQNVFQAFPDTKTRDLVILSDMVENSKRYPFTTKNLQPAAVAKFIATEKRDGYLPDLRSVDAYIDGAGVTRGADSDPFHVQVIKSFWLKYFAAAGATLPPYRYAPALVEFP